MTQLAARPLTREGFAPFGEVLLPDTSDFKLINAGLCERHHDLATLEAGDGRMGVSLFKAHVRDLPLSVDLLERHPVGSQCFIPMGASAYIVTVARDEAGHPGAPFAFLATGDQAINLPANTWHGVLAPVSGTGLFAVVDRIGPGANLEEFHLPEPYTVSVDPDLLG